MSDEHISVTELATLCSKSKESIFKLLQNLGIKVEHRLSESSGKKTAYITKDEAFRVLKKLADKKTSKTKIKEWNQQLPNANAWKPRNVENKIGELFAIRCRHIRERIIRDSSHERELNINNFDSGSGIEDIVRRELTNLCPRRYLVTAGTIDDRNGHTAGDYEVIIADDFWTPVLKAGATSSSRKIHLPIEAIYAVIEVKQSIDFEILDDAMEKVITSKRLYRPPLPASRILENLDLTFEIANSEYEIAHIPDIPVPLFTAILAIDLKPGIDMSGLMQRFVAINKKLKRDEVVQVLCVLNAGCVFWGWIDDSSSVAALFREDEKDRNLYPTFHFMEDERDPFYPFATLLLKNLFITTLPLHELPMVYGQKQMTIESFFPNDYDLSLKPDSGNPNMTETEVKFLNHIKELNTKRETNTE